MDRTLVATIFTGLIAAGSLISITVLAAIGSDIPNEVGNILLLSAGGTITAAGVATATNKAAN